MFTLFDIWIVVVVVDNNDFFIYFTHIKDKLSSKFFNEFLKYKKNQIIKSFCNI